MSSYFVQGTLDSANNVVIPKSPLVYLQVGDGGGNGGGGGGGSSNVAITNFPNTYPLPATANVAINNLPTTYPLPANTSVGISGTVAVSGPLTDAQLTAVSGAASDAAWSGTGDGTIIALLKSLHAQNVIMIGHLETIAINTTPP